MPDQIENAPPDGSEPAVSQRTARAIADQLCLWHLCPRAGCRRRQRCRGRDAAACLRTLSSLTPEEARIAIAGRFLARECEVSQEEADFRLAPSDAALAEWAATCRAARGRAQ